MNETSIEVFNLLENDPVTSDYFAALGLYDKMICWQRTDDENNLRWVGIPIHTGARLVRLAEAVGAVTNVTCNLVLNNGVEAEMDELGYNINVYARVIGDGNLNEAIPRMEDDDYVMAENIHGKWWFTTDFQITEDCECVATGVTSSSMVYEGEVLAYEGEVLEWYY